MSQTLNLSVSGLYTATSDLNGLPPGALERADNVECRHKNLVEPRRGFEGLLNSEIDGKHFVRGTNFWIDAVDRVLALTSDGDLLYYNGLAPWVTVPGPYSSDISPPNAIHAKSRFIKAGQNLYLTTNVGVRSLSSGTSAQTLRAGVPKGLNLQAATNGDTSGFFDNNTVLSTTGNITSGSADLTQLTSTTELAVGNYVSGTDIPAGTKISSITPSATIIVQTGNLTAGATSITNVVSITGIVAGVLVSGEGIPSGAKVVSTSGAGPYTVVLNQAAYQTAIGVSLTFSSSIVVSMDHNATGNHTGATLTFYKGAQVAYRMVFGRVETDVTGQTLTRLGTPSSSAIAENTLGTPTNVTVTGTIPKGAQGEITFVQLYRSEQTDSIDITPLDQYQLVYERDLVAGDFTARVITITDIVTDSLKGIPLYTGSDQEGILQANDPPPMAWDMCKFRDFTLFGNITRPSTLQFTVTSVGAPNGVQINDTITITGTLLGVAFSGTYTGAATENAAAGEFKIVTSGTPSQNITDTVNSLIRVINYDESVPVHAILLSTSTDLSGQILLEADNPTIETFEVTASAHASAYDPTLTNIESELNTINHGIAASKTGELEAAPSGNLNYVGDSSSDLLRLIPLRDYVIAIKSDGVYKVQGSSPSSLIVNPFDLTTKIIGSETAVSLNSAVWMLSTQGVVSISDGGVEAKSFPIDDQINRIIGSYLDNVIDAAVAVGYESDRKYILALPDSSDPYGEVEFCFNYVTNAWTTWSRNIYSAFIHSNENKLYIMRADSSHLGISRERKQNNYKDYVDEALDNTIISISGVEITLANVNNVEAGDILYQSATLYSLILSVDSTNNRVTVQYQLNFTVGVVSILEAFRCRVTWKQVFGDNPAFLRQFSEGMVLFKNTRFNVATASFVTDFSQSQAEVELAGTGNGIWGLFAWGEVPWGGNLFPSNIRFFIPQDKQLGSYLLPTLEINQGFSDFKLQGLAISYYNQSQEAGK